MTIDEFLVALATCKDQFHWFLLDKKAIRAAKQPHEIKKDDSDYYCPITAVVFSQTGNWHHPLDANNAKNKIGLSRNDSLNIMCAADIIPEIECETKSLRSKLEEILF